MHTASSALLTGVLTHLWSGGHGSDEASGELETGCAATQYCSNLSAVDNEPPANKDRCEARGRVVVTAQGFCRIARVITTNKAVEQSGFAVGFLGLRKLLDSLRHHKTRVTTAQAQRSALKTTLPARSGNSHASRQRAQKR